MCGIAGFFSLNDRSLPVGARETVGAQIACLRYRGPDAYGSYLGPGVALGHARLSIIDTSSAANQPMFDATGKVCVVFNGEIYNFQEIRNELEARGVRFKTTSDTEVLVEGYRVWGLDIVHRLRGMFAIALFDEAQDRLVFFRDRIGKKPLYYAVHDNKLIFASEIKGILSFPGFPREPDYEAIHEYLTFQYVPSPMTAFRGINKLPPAHMLVAERHKAPRVSRYFALPRPSQTRARPIEVLKGELIEHLRESTALRMIADVPIGAFLSGGVDSSSVVAMMAMLSKTPVKTFTIGFEEQIYDERPFARQVAQRYKTDHHEEIVRPDGMSVINDLVYHYGEPYADSSAVPTYYVSRIARKHVTVALNGDGGDESFLGYPRYLRCRDGYQESPSILPRPLARNLAAMLKRLPADGIGLQKQARRAADLIYQRRSPFYEVSIAYFSEAAKLDLYTGDMRRFLKHPALSRLDPYFDQAQTAALGAAWADVHNYLPDCLMVKVDVASMAHSLEARSPLLDHKLMEWAAAIPEEQRFHGSELKSLFKQAMEPYLPRDLLYRPKMGFGVPVDMWLRTDMRSFAYDTLLSTRARQRGLFNPEYVRGLLDRHMAGENRAYWIWALLMLELWFQMWIDSESAFAHPVAQRIVGKGRSNSAEASALEYA
jgi:asparagine synthase (glutamine-hydrolysing)